MGGHSCQKIGLHFSFTVNEPAFKKQMSSVCNMERSCVFVCVCVRVHARACMRVCVLACVLACVRAFVRHWRECGRVCVGGHG